MTFIWKFIKGIFAWVANLAIIIPYLRLIVWIMTLLITALGLISNLPKTQSENFNTWTKENPQSFSTSLPSTPGNIWIDGADNMSQADIDELIRVTGTPFVVLELNHKILSGYSDNVAADISAAHATGLIEDAGIDVEVHAYDLPTDTLPEVPNDPLYERQWHMKAMGAPYGWTNSSHGRGVVVAVLDTGVSPVEDLDVARILPGKSFIDGEPTTEDFNGHGTHCAGTIGQSTNNGLGVAGVAPEVSILPVKVLSASGGGSAASVASGIYWAADNGAQILSMSLGSSSPSSAIQKALQHARSKGVVIAAAAGNDGPREGVGYPGAFPETIGVSSTGPDGKLAYYSSWGKGVDIAAPGGNKKIKGGGVWQNTIDEDNPSNKKGVYAEFQGTSMATPHVAGALAVLVGQGLTPDQAADLMLKTARNETGGAWDPKFGWGNLDLEAALKQAPTGPGGGDFGYSPVLITALLTVLVLTAAQVPNWFRAVAFVTAILTGVGVPFVTYFGIDHGLAGIIQTLNGTAFLWQSLVPAAFLTFVFGTVRFVRAPLLGLVLGQTFGLLVWTATGYLLLTPLPLSLRAAWVLLNFLIGIGCSLSLVGLEKVESKDLK